MSVRKVSDESGDPVRREGHSKLHGRPLDEDGAIELTVQRDPVRPRPEAIEAIPTAKLIWDCPEVIAALRQELEAVRQQLAEANEQRIAEVEHYPATFSGRADGLNTAADRLAALLASLREP